MTVLEFTLLLGLGLGHFVFILKNTDFISEYAQLFSLDDFFHLEKYETWKKNNNIAHDYPTFLEETFLDGTSRLKKWALKLFRCPFCLVTFLCLLLSILSFSLIFPLIGLSAAGIASLTFLMESCLYNKFNS